MKTRIILIVLATLLVGCEDENIEISNNAFEKETAEPNEPNITPTNTFRFTKESSQEVILGIGEDGKLFVEGNLDEGAKLFFEAIVKPMADEYIREHCELND